MIVGIEHTAIASPDPHRLADWYVRNLDFVINYQSATSKTVFVKAPNGSMIEIIEANDTPRPPQTFRDAGIRHMAILVSDFEGAYARLQANGTSFLTQPEGSKGNKVVFFTDPDGNILHLLHREQPLP
jgi:glyoxylase I family protein